MNHRSNIVVTLAFSMLLAAIGTGCTPKAPPAEKNEPVASVIDGGATDALIESVIGILRNNPDPSAHESVLRQLNHFVGLRGESIPALDDDAKARVEQLLGRSAIARCDRKTFDKADANYLTSCVFLGGVVRPWRARTGDALSLAESLFEWLNRNVLVTPPGEWAEGPPVFVSLRGLGSPIERSWIFLELLRQAGLQGCVVALPAESEGEAVTPWLCGLFDRNEVYLFDPALGVPVTGADGKTATLRDLIDRPNEFGRWTASLPRSSDESAASALRRVSLLLLVESEMLAPRMRFVEERLGGDRRVELYLNFDNLLATAYAAAKTLEISGGVRAWQYPQRIKDRLAEDQAAQFALAASSNLSWHVPNSARMRQLAGDHEGAIDLFVQQDMEGMPPALMFHRYLAGRPLPVRHVIASRMPQDLIYFTGLSKLSLDPSEPEVADQWFSRYMERFDGWKLRPFEILDWGRLSQRLMQSPTAETSDLAAKIGQSLDAPSRELFAKTASDYQQARQQAQSLQERGDVEEAAQVGYLPADPPRMLAALNAILERPELSQSISLAGQPVRPQLRELLDRSPRTPSEQVKLNRLILEAVFPEEILRGDRVWIAAVLRHRAIALAEQGKRAEGAALLKAGHPDLPEIQREMLNALADSWERADGPADAAVGQPQP